MATKALSSSNLEVHATNVRAQRDERFAFGLLGPLEVWVEGRAIELRRRQHRLLLALLLLHTGEVVSRDTLVEHLWNENPPRAAVGSLQNLVSELRKALGSQLVRTRAIGYALDVERECVDLHRFEGLLEKASASACVEHRSARLREALELWRGPPLTDFTYESFAQVEIARLEELRTGACEELVEAELELGFHGRVVGELEALVAEHPLRERFRAQLMLALYRSGRQAEALAVYKDARRTLSEDLGLEPGEELQRLERAILVHDPLLRAHASVSLPRGNGMEFRVLGPLEVRADGKLLRTGRTKQRALLAFLLLHPNQAVSREQLIEALWGKQPPETAATALHGYVSGLRKAIGAERIETRAPGYLLHAGVDELDLLRFERLLAEARDLEPDPAAERLRVALTMWRGRPLADLDPVPFVPAERLRLEELRLSAVEERAEADLALGRHVALIAELQALVREYPMRERLREQLMLALYRSGRQAEALGVYQQARHLFAEELGLEPGAALKRLELAILEQDPALQPTAADAPAAAVRGPPLLRRARVPATFGVLLLLGAALAVAAALSRRQEGGVTVAPNSVAVVDAKTNSLVADVPVGRKPVAVAVGAGGVWVANAGDRTISRIEPQTRKLVGEIGIGTDVHDVATGFGAVWVADGTDGTVTRIDPKLNTVEKTIRLEPENETPEPVFWIATGAGAVWATHGNTVVQIDPATNVVRSRVDIPAPTGLTSGFGAAWVVTQSQRLVEIRPGSSRVRTRAIGRRFRFEADTLAPTVGAGSLWLIVYRGTGEIWRIDPRSDAVRKITASTSRYPLDIAVPDSADAVWAVDVTGAVIRLNPEVGFATAKIATAPTIRSALAVGHGDIWVAVQD